MENMSYLGEKLTRIVFILKTLVWMLVTTFGLIFSALITKKDANCPYSTKDGDSETIRALNYQ